MPRKQGDKDYSVREKRLIAEKAFLDAKLKAAKAEVKAKQATIRELREKLGN